MPAFDKFEEYKLFVEDTARFSERRQTVGNLFVTVNTLLLTAIAFLVRDSGARDYGLLVTVLPIPLVIAGVFVCVWWRQIICKYKDLVKLRMRELEAIEALPEMKDCQRVYHKEHAELYARDSAGNKLPRRRLNLSELESRLPLLFIILYAVFGAFLLVALVWQVAKL